MKTNILEQVIDQVTTPDKKFMSINFGCRVNAAELNQLSQVFLEQGFSPLSQGLKGEVTPDVILINTCSVTKKADIESLSRIRTLHRQYPGAKIIATGCATLQKVDGLENIITINNKSKEELLKDLRCAYTPQIEDKFSHTKRFLLKVQSGCSQMCTYCIVPYRRPYLWSLSLDDALATATQAIKNGYEEIIITGVNLEQYEPGFSNLVEILLTKTNIKLISYGSIPVNCVDNKFINLLSKYSHRLSLFLHIPLQSGSTKILKKMNRPYDQPKILEMYGKLKEIPVNLHYGTDIIVGFPGETESDFQDTLKICQRVGFTKIHRFKYSARPQSAAKALYKPDKLLTPAVLAARLEQIKKIEL